MSPAILTAAEVIKHLIPLFKGSEGAEVSPDIQLKLIDLAIAEASTKTVPWVDALHKMGRQIQWVVFMLLVVANGAGWLSINDLQMGMLAGLGGIYQYQKGTGAPVFNAFGKAVEAIKRTVGPPGK